MSRSNKHSGAIKALQFNPKHSNLLATGGAKGELFLSDLNNLENPFRLGNNAARTDDIDCLDWNKKVAHILVTGSSGGFVTVWDVKTKKESLTLNNMGRKAVSAVAWHPEKPTTLITATPLESDPVICVWDLRNSHAPERTLKGHESGVLSLSWCDHDPDLLLSSGKDNRNICWNPQTGQAYGEFPVVTNWTFQTRWNPHNPNFFATAAFDGKISVQTLQNTKTDTAQAIDDQNQALDGEDFFAKAQTQPQVSKFSLPKPPRWMERPCGASFGFGGRVVSLGLADKTKRTSTIKITPFQVDESVGNSTESFEAALKEGDLRTLCETRASDASNEEEKADWKVIEALLSENPRKGLVEYLGFQDQSADEAADSLAKLGLDKKDDEESNGAAEKPKAGGKKHKRLQSMFDATPDSDNFLSDLAASKGARTNNPFQIYNGSESEAEQNITRSLLLGEFDKALDVALQEDRMSDAFMIAICGGPKCIEKAQEYYFSKQTDGPNYMRLLASIVGKNLWDVVHNADLSNWKEVMVSLCTFADQKEFPDLCDALGDRLEEQVRGTDDKAARKDASFCYLAGSKLEKVVGIWVEELRENEQKGLENDSNNSTFSIHVRALQALIEKVTIFRQVTNFQDTERTKESDWRLGTLYEKYIEYADVVATHGRLQVAQKYLDLVPEKHPEAEVARNRIRLAMRQAPQQKTQAAATASSFKPLPQQPNAYMAQQTWTPPAATVGVQNPYAPTQSPIASYTPAAPTPAAPSAPVNPYAPQAAAAPAQPANPYAALSTGGGYTPAGYQPTQGMKPTAFTPQPQFGGQPAAAGVPPPPRASNQSPANTITTYTTATGLPAWNDLPEGFAKQVSRRGTPAAGPATISSPFPNQSPPLAQGPPPAGGPRAPSVPPPPKAGAAPPRVTSPLASSGAPGPTPPPPVNPYASLPGSPPVSHMAPPASIPRGPSPYNAPPSGAPPPSRYAPNPAAQQAAPLGAVPPPAAASPYAPVAAAQPPPPNPYASAPPPPAAAVPPPPRAAVPPPPQGPPRPGAAQPQAAAPPPPAANKYRKSSSSRIQWDSIKILANPSLAAGDRSHIPPNALPVYQIFSPKIEFLEPRAPEKFKKQIQRSANSMNEVFDRLNNETFKADTVSKLVNLAQAVEARRYDVATKIHSDLLVNNNDEYGSVQVSISNKLQFLLGSPTNYDSRLVSSI